MPKQIRTSDFLYQINVERDEYVVVKVPGLVKQYFEQEAQEKGLTLSEEAYLRLYESLETDHESSCLFDDDEQAVPYVGHGPDWNEMIFNEALAVNEKIRRAKRQDNV